MKKILLAVISSALLSTGIGHAEMIFITNYGDNSITEIDSTNGDVSNYVSHSGDLNSPTGFAFNGGNTYVASDFNNKIAAYGSDGTFLGNYATSGIGSRGVAFDSEGNMYVAVQSSGTIEKYAPGGGLGTSFATGLASPNGIAFNNGNLFVADGGSNSITEILPNGSTLPVTFSGPALMDPCGLAFDSKGNIFVVNACDPSIEEISNGKGTIFASINASDLPKALAIDGDGNVFVTDYGDNTVTEYNSAGTVVNTFKGLPCGPAGIAIQPGSDPVTVPEPSTYALLMAGAGVLFFVNRRRRQLAKI
jgi:PEP-CTERM motif